MTNLSCKNHKIRVIRLTQRIAGVSEIPYSKALRRLSAMILAHTWPAVEVDDLFRGGIDQRIRLQFFHCQQCSESFSNAQFHRVDKRDGF